MPQIFRGGRDLGWTVMPRVMRCLLVKDGPALVFGNQPIEGTGLIARHRQRLQARSEPTFERRCGIVLAFDVFESDP